LRLAAEAQRWSKTFSFETGARMLRLALEETQAA
jgi:hypothetical protein